MVGPKNIPARVPVVGIITGNMHLYTLFMEIIPVA